MFNFVYLAQDKGWRLDRAVIAIYTSPFLTQQEQEGITSLIERIRATSAAQCIEAKEGGIRSKGQQIKSKDTTPLVNDLKIKSIFKDKTKEGGGSITDLVINIYQLLRQDLQELVKS